MTGDWPEARCKANSCGARIVWATNVASGRRMPVDAEPTAEGNVVLLHGNDGPEARVLSKADVAKRGARLDGTYDLRTSHFATCPEAGSFRRGG